MPLRISAAEASHQIQEELAVESKEENHSSDENGEDSEDTLSFVLTPLRIFVMSKLYSFDQPL